jgi:hypothetical protein
MTRVTKNFHRQDAKYAKEDLIRTFSLGDLGALAVHQFL